MPNDDTAWWRQRREDRARESGRIEWSGRAMLRPRQLVLSSAAADLVGDVVAGDYAGTPDPDLQALAELGIQRWDLATDEPVPAVVARLRAVAAERVDDESPPGSPVTITANHVLSGAPRWQGGPADHPRAVDERAEPEERRTGDKPDLAVLDTGYDPAALGRVPALAAAIRPDADDPDALSAVPGGPLLAEAGHGTFICGLVLRVAPGLSLDPGRVLDPDGFGDDVSIATELLETVAPVVNLSLGGYTIDDAAPAALAAVIAGLDRERVVVAAAGNDGGTGPFWPAALKGVVAVAAVADPDSPAPTTWTNRGPWVDLCTQGADLLAPYVEGLFPTGPADAEDFTGRPWAAWSGTSFAAPLVAAEIARRVRDGAGALTAAAALRDLVGELSPVPGHPGLGLLYVPPLDPRLP